MSETQTTSQASSVAPADEGKLRRSIQMKDFISPPDRRKFDAECKLALADPANHKTPDPITLGQIVGVMFSVREQEGQLPSGEKTVSLIGVGDFEGTCYKTGEVFESTAAYLPRYFLETCRDMLKQVPTVELAIEVLIEPTGKEVSFAYAVRRLLQRSAENPINRLKADLAKAGKLRLPPPPETVAALPGEIRAIEADPASDGGDGTGDEDDQPNPDGGGTGDQPAQDKRKRA